METQMVKKQPDFNIVLQRIEQQHIETLQTLDSIMDCLILVADKIAKIDFAAAIIGLADGKSPVTIIQPESQDYNDRIDP